MGEVSRATPLLARGENIFCGADTGTAAASGIDSGRDQMHSAFTAWIQECWVGWNTIATAQECGQSSATIPCPQCLSRTSYVGLAGIRRTWQVQHRNGSRLAHRGRLIHENDRTHLDEVCLTSAERANATEPEPCDLIDLRPCSASNRVGGA